MRKFQIGLFIFAAAALIAAACCIGKQVGNDFRRAGIAALLLDIVCIQLWPTADRRNEQGSAHMGAVPHYKT